MNISTHSFLFFCNYYTGASNQSADFLFSLIAPKIKKACNNNVTYYNSLATDTCSAMRSLHTKIGDNFCFKHVFFVFCDLHRIQLLLKKIFELLAYSSIFKKLSLLLFYSFTLSCNWLYFEKSRLFSTDRLLLLSYQSSLAGALNTILLNH